MQLCINFFPTNRQTAPLANLFHALISRTVAQSLLPRTFEERGLREGQKAAGQGNQMNPTSSTASPEGPPDIPRALDTTGTPLYDGQLDHLAPVHDPTDAHPTACLLRACFPQNVPSCVCGFVWVYMDYVRQIAKVVLLLGSISPVRMLMF